MEQKNVAFILYGFIVGRENVPLNIGSIDQRKTLFQARVTENSPQGYTIETIIDGKVLHGVLFSNRDSSVQMADPSFTNRQGLVIIPWLYFLFWSISSKAWLICDC